MAIASGCNCCLSVIISLPAGAAARVWPAVLVVERVASFMFKILFIGLHAGDFLVRPVLSHYDGFRIDLGNSMLTQRGLNTRDRQGARGAGSRGRCDRHSGLWRALRQRRAAFSRKLEAHLLRTAWCRRPERRDARRCLGVAAWRDGRRERARPRRLSADRDPAADRTRQADRHFARPARHFDEEDDRGGQRLRHLLHLPPP